MYGMLNECKSRKRFHSWSNLHIRFEPGLSALHNIRAVVNYTLDGISSMIDWLIRKLDQLGPLSEEERRLLEAFPLEVRAISPGHDFIREGERPSECYLIVEGLVCRSKSKAVGRQIVSFHLPGDVIDLTSLLLGQMDHNVSALNPVKVAAIPNAILLDWMARYPNLGRLFWRDTLIDASIYRQWVLNVGLYSGYARVAHPICELVTRLRVVGLAQVPFCILPLTEVTLADATGLPIVHVNRALLELSSLGLIAHHNGVLTVLDWEGLKQAADFDPAYLHQFALAA